MTSDLENVINGNQKRIVRQNDLYQQYHLPVLTLTLNLPSAFAKKLITQEIFSEAIDAVQKRIFQLSWGLKTRQVAHLNIGSEAYWVVDTKSAHDLKKEMIRIEKEHVLGRVFNLDVIDHHGRTISRKSCEMMKRGCPICGKAAHISLSTHRHSLEETEQLVALLGKSIQELNGKKAS